MLSSKKEHLDVVQKCESNVLRIHILTITPPLLWVSKPQKGCYCNTDDGILVINRRFVIQACLISILCITRTDYFGQRMVNVLNRCYIVLMLNSFVVLHDGIIMVSVVFEILSIYFNVDSLLIFYHDLKQKFFYFISM